MHAFDWDDLRVFAAVAREGSVRAAGQMLGIHPSTVTRRIDALEQRLGTRLVHRLPGGFQLTESGTALADQASAVEEQMSTIERSLSGQGGGFAREIRLTLPDAVAVMPFVLDALTDFNTANPGVRVNIIPTFALLDLGRRESDIAVRVTRSPPEHLIARPLGRFATCVYGSAELLARNPAPASLPWIDWQPASSDSTGHLQSPWPDAHVSAAAQNTVVVRELVAHGHGLAHLPCALGDLDRRLARVPGQAPQLRMPMWLMTHPDYRHAAPIRDLMDAIAARWRARQDLVEGRLAADDVAAPQASRVRVRDRSPAHAD